MNFFDSLTNFFGFKSPQEDAVDSHSQNDNQQPSPFFSALQSPFKSYEGTTAKKILNTEPTISKEKRQQMSREVATGFGSFLRSFPREIKAIDNTFSGEKTIPTTKYQKFIFGDKPIGNVGEEVGAPLLEIGGVDTSKGGGKYAALAVGGILAPLDFVSFGGASKVAKLIGATQDVNKIRETIKGLGFIDSLIEKNLPALVKADAVESEKILKQMQKEHKVLVDKFNKTATDPNTLTHTTSPENAYNILKSGKLQPRVARGEEMYNKSPSISFSRQKNAGYHFGPIHFVFDEPKLTQKVGKIKAYMDSGVKSESESRLFGKEVSLDSVKKIEIDIDRLDPQQVIDIENLAKEKGIPVVKTGEKAGSKERGFAKSVRTAEDTPPELAAKINENYNVLHNKVTLEEANKLIQTDELAARRLVESSDQATALSSVTAELLVKKAIQKGDFEDVVDITEKYAKRLTTSGQASQAMAMYGRLTPEGILRYAQKTLKSVNLEKKFTPELAKKLATKAKEVETMADGEDKLVETAVLLKNIQDVIPSGLWKKVGSIQTMMQLLNPKTITRNILGNLAFSGLEKATQALSTPLDFLTSLATKKRTTSLPSIGKEVTSFKKGFRQGIKEALKGVNTTGVTSQFELPRNTFKGGLMEKAERGLAVVLGGPDRAFYQAAKDGSLYRQMKAAGVTKATAEMEEIAHFDGLYATFQDENALSRAFIQLKHVLNFQKDFGVGDFLLKYPKTPANLLSRGLAYSPAGFAKAAFELAQPLMGKAFNQKKFVESTSRALIGTGGIIGSGAILHKLGIITGQREQDTDINAVQNLTGLGQYKMNISALKRFVLSGFNPDLAKIQEGDKLISYDWLQPAAIGLSMGANFDESKGGKTSALSAGVDALASGVNTLAEQPLVSGLTNTLKYSQKASDIPLNIFKGVPASFVPTLLGQIRYLTDNTQRSTIADNKIKEALNLAQNKIPGLEKKLPEKIGVFGDVKEQFQNGSNNVFNVFFNPAFASTYATTPESKLVLDMFNASGETKQAPRLVQTSVKVNGVNTKLKPNQMKYMQEYVGKTTREMFNRLAQNPQFLAMSDADKANYMSTLMTNIGSAAKILILGDRPKKKDGSLNANTMVKELLTNYKPLQ